MGDVKIGSTESFITDFIDRSISEKLPRNYISIQAYLNPVQEN